MSIWDFCHLQATTISCRSDNWSHSLRAGSRSIRGGRTHCPWSSDKPHRPIL